MALPAVATPVTAMAGAGSTVELRPAPGLPKVRQRAAETGGWEVAPGSGQIDCCRIQRSTAAYIDSRVRKAEVRSSVRSGPLRCGIGPWVGQIIGYGGIQSFEAIDRGAGPVLDVMQPAKRTRKRTARRWGVERCSGFTERKRPLSGSSSHQASPCNAGTIRPTSPATPRRSSRTRRRP
jgi:hypothetical protein